MLYVDPDGLTGSVGSTIGSDDSDDSEGIDDCIGAGLGRFVCVVLAFFTLLSVPFAALRPL